VVSKIKVSEKYNQIICKDLRIVIEKMKSSRDLDENVYYFSAAHSIFNRIFNIEFNKHLVFINFILSKSFNIVARAVDITKQGKHPITIDQDFFNELITLLEELVKFIELNENAYETLEKITLLVYSITGNGYFLKQKGVKILDY